MSRLVAVDIGGTHARFCIASTCADGALALGEVITLKTGDYVSLQTAWEAFEARVDEPVPRAAAIAIAGPMTGETVRMTNNSWVLQTGSLDEQLGLDAVTVLNDFAAVAHAVAQASADCLHHIAGPPGPLPETGTTSVVGPGTGLGVAHFRRDRNGYCVTPTEGGHVDFAPVDAVDDAILAALRKEHRRVSTERVNSGPGIVAIYRTLCELEGRDQTLTGDRAIWEAALAGSDAMANAALQRFCMTLGSAAGDYALVHGANAVVMAGGLGYRIRKHLISSAFSERFRFKGRYEALMSKIPVKLIVQEEPGLIGAAAAFLQQHGDC